jgi:hypothetical protein
MALHPNGDRHLDLSAETRPKRHVRRAKQIIGIYLGTSLFVFIYPGFYAYLSTYKTLTTKCLIR